MSVHVQWSTTRTESEATSAAAALFESEFQAPPVGVWAAPGRVNLIGEHVDYAGGVCLPFALTQCTFVAASPRDDGAISVVSNVKDKDGTDVTHYKSFRSRAEYPSLVVRLYCGNRVGNG